MQPDEDYADYAEVSESDSQELARGLGLETNAALVNPASPRLVPTNQIPNYPNASQLRLLLVDSDSQVGRQLQAFCSPMLCSLIAQLLFLSQTFPRLTVQSCQIVIHLSHRIS